MPAQFIAGLLLLAAAAFAQAASVAPPEGELPTAEAADAAADAQQTFDIWEFHVEGNTLLPTIDVERVVYAHLGESRSIDDVTAAQQQLQSLYHGKGYGSVFVDIPEQDVLNGVVRLKVTESQISRLRVTGSRYFSLGRIKSKVPSLQAQAVPHLPTVQEEITKLAAMSPDRTITPVLRPSRTPGKLEVELKVKDELPLHGNLELNDRFAADTTRLRLGASVRYDNLWQREHSIGGSYQVSPQDPSEVEVIVGTYLWRFEHSNRLLALYGVKSNTDVATIGTLGVLGAGIIAGARYTVPLPTLGKYFQTFNLGFDYKDFDEVIGFEDADVVATPISYMMFSTAYSGSWFLDKAVGHVNLQLNLGPRGLGNTEKEFENKRFKATPNFAYVKLTLDHLQPFWREVALFAKLDLQASDSPMITNEAYSAGGVDNARGYIEAEVLGDDALAGTLEIRSPNWRHEDWDWFGGLQILTFTDAVLLNTQSPLPGSPAGNFLWSAGLGFRVRAADSLQAMVFWAYPLVDGDRTPRGDDRVHFSLGYDF
jgi:hemolysin activation/secretion protein